MVRHVAAVVARETRLGCWCCGAYGRSVLFYWWHPMMGRSWWHPAQRRTWCAECKFGVCDQCRISREPEPLMRHQVWAVWLCWLVAGASAVASVTRIIDGHLLLGVLWLVVTVTWGLFTASSLRFAFRVHNRYVREDVERAARHRRAGKRIRWWPDT